MRKFLCMLLCLCMVYGSALSISANSFLGRDDETADKRINFEINVVTKDMVTGEIKNDTIFYKPQATVYANGVIGGIQAGWFPSIDNKVIHSNDEGECYDITNTISSKSDDIDPIEDGVIGNDDREIISNTKTYPYSAICYLETVWPDGTVTVGTAWMFGSNKAATAGHNLYVADRGGWAVEVTVWPGKDGNGLFSNHFGKAKMVSKMADPYVNNGQSSDYDWGIIELTKSLGDKTGWFGYSWIQNDINNCTLTLSGYPYDHLYYQLKASGPIISTTETRLYFEMDATAGQSGSPLYTSDYTVYGIFIATRPAKFGLSEMNVALRINAEVYYYLSHFLT